MGTPLHKRCVVTYLHSSVGHGFFILTSINTDLYLNIKFKYIHNYIFNWPDDLFVYLNICLRS